MNTKGGRFEPPYVGCYKSSGGFRSIPVISGHLEKNYEACADDRAGLQSSICFRAFPGALPQASAFVVLRRDRGIDPGLWPWAEEAGLSGDIRRYPTIEVLACGHPFQKAQ